MVWNKCLSCCCRMSQHMNIFMKALWLSFHIMNLMSLVKTGVSTLWQMPHCQNPVYSCTTVADNHFKFFLASTTHLVQFQMSSTDKGSSSMLILMVSLMSEYMQLFFNFFDGVRLRLWPAATNGHNVYPPDDIWVWRAMVEWYWQGKTEELGEKPVPVC
jgi:hypothetical protein